MPPFLVFEWCDEVLLASSTSWSMMDLTLGASLWSKASRMILWDEGSQ